MRDGTLFFPSWWDLASLLAAKKLDDEEKQERIVNVGFRARKNKSPQHR